MRYFLLVLLAITLTACGSSPDNDALPTMAPTADLGENAGNQSPRIEETSTPENLLPPTYTPQPTIIPTIIGATATPSNSNGNGTVTTTESPYPTPAPGQETYLIEPGDTLGEIALEFDVSIDELAALNNITDYDVIIIDAVLVIP